jgi:hypothetical protein
MPAVAARGMNSRNNALARRQGLDGSKTPRASAQQRGSDQVFDGRHRDRASDPFRPWSGKVYLPLDMPFLSVRRCQDRFCPSGAAKDRREPTFAGEERDRYR